VIYAIIVRLCVIYNRRYIFYKGLKFLIGMAKVKLIEVGSFPDISFKKESRKTIEEILKPVDISFLLRMLVGQLLMKFVKEMILIPNSL